MAHLINHSTINDDHPSIYKYIALAFSLVLVSIGKAPLHSPILNESLAATKQSDDNESKLKNGSYALLLFEQEQGEY